MISSLYHHLDKGLKILNYVITTHNKLYVPKTYFVDLPLSGTLKAESLKDKDV